MTIKTEYGTQEFLLEHFTSEMAACSFLTEASTCSAASSSRRCSEVSFTGSSVSSSSFSPSSFSPASPISGIAQLEEYTQGSNPFVPFSSSILPFFSKESANLDLCGSVPTKDLELMNQHISPSMTYPSLDLSRESLNEFSIFSTDQTTCAYSVNPYSSNVSAVLPNEMADIPLMHPTPPFIIPSQVLMDHDSQPEPFPSPFLAELTEAAREEVIEAYYQREGAVGRVSWRPLNGPISSHGTSTRRQRPRKTSRSGSKCLERTLKPLCTRATATKLKKHICALCNKGFDRHEHFKRHQISDAHRSKEAESEKRDLGPLSRTFPCPKCKHVFNRRDNLKPHILTHFVVEGKHPRNDEVTLAESEQFGWQEFDPRFSPKERSLGRKKNRSMGVRVR